MQDYQEGDIADGPNGALVFRNGAWVPLSAAPAPVRVGTPNPYAMPKAAADLQSAQAREAREQAKADREAREWAATHNPDGSPKPSANSNGSAELTAATRANAINAFTATRQLDQLIAGIEDRYRAGPGSTSGIGGVLDYLPIPSNREFDDAGNAVRGAAITALGFTSGQTNSPKEVEMNIGPYIPKAGDYDSQIEGKIARLKELRNRARVQAVTVLGGVPDASGKITPLSQLPQQNRDELFPPGTLQPFDPGAAGTPVAPPSVAPSLGGPGRPLAPDEMVHFSGDAAPVTGSKLRPDQEAEIIGAIRNGDEGQALALLGRYTGAPPGTGEVASVRAAISQVRKDPRTPVGLNYGKVDSYAQSQDDIARYGNNLPAAMDERANAAGLDVSARSGINGLTAGLADYAAAAGGMLNGGSFQENLQREKALTEADARLHPTNSFYSSVVGGGLGAALTEGATTALLPARAAAWAPRIGDAVYGMAAGATSAAPGQEAQGAMTGAPAGLIGGVTGRGIARGTGNVLRGVRDVSVDALRSRGVPLTVGQAVGQSGRLGAIIKGVEDRLAGFPVVGDLVNARRREGIRGFNSAAFNEAIPDAARDVGEVGIGELQDAVTGQYQQALGGVQATADAPFVGEMGAALRRGAAVPRTGPEFQHVVNTRIAPIFNAGNGTINGRQLQDALQGIRGARFGNDAMGADATAALGDVEDAITGLVGRQAPEVIPRLQAANSAYRQSSILADAVGKGVNTEGLFTPAQLGIAARSNANRFGNSMRAASTERPFFALQRAGQNLLPSTVPDSGTAGRIATLALPGMFAGAGAGAGYLGGDTGGGTAGGLGIGALLALGGTRGGQRLLTSALVDRPDALVRIGDQINRRARIGGMFGAPLAAGGVPLLLEQ